MRATTIKLEGKLLQRLTSAKPKEMSITAFVKEILARELERQKLRKAGYEYAAFLREQPEAYGEDQEWEKASLSEPPRKRRKGS